MIFFAKNKNFFGKVQKIGAFGGHIEQEAYFDPKGVTILKNQCEQCGEKMPQEARFCPTCGARFSEMLVCPQCFSDIPRGRLCMNCGYVLDDRLTLPEK